MTENQARTNEATPINAERLPIPYQSLDTTGQIVSVNQAWLDRLGYERETVEGEPFVTFLSDQSVEAFHNRFPTLLKRGHIAEADFTLRHANGHLTRVSYQGTVEYDDAGDPQNTHCQFYEVQAKGNREDRLAVQNAKIESLHDVARELEQATSEATIYEMLIETAQAVLDFDVAIADAAEDGYLVTKAMSAGIPEEAYFERVPIEAETKLGTAVYRNGETSLIRDLDETEVTDVDHEYRSALTVPIGEHGVFQAVDTEPGAFDETDRDLAELLISHVRNALSRLENIQELEARTTSLRRERNRLEAIFEAVPEPVSHIRYENGTPIVVAVNSAFEAVFGYTTAEIAGRSINDLIVPERDLNQAQELDEAAETASMVEDVVERITADGRRTFKLRSSVLETGGETETLAIYVDLTEQKERERELERENERLEQFASIVSHDLRSPLTVAKGRLELLEEGIDSPHVHEIERSIDRMDAIIDDVLTLTRGGQTVERAETEPVDVAELALEAWEAVDSSAATVDVTDTGTVRADRSRLRRVFENLFWNAVEHAGPDVTVTVGPREDGFYVADDGPGIPSDDREQVFESGYTTTRDGTGLGLDIVEDILEAHGWTVELGVSADGGTRFDVRTR